MINEETTDEAPSGFVAMLEGATEALENDLSDQAEEEAPELQEEAPETTETPSAEAEEEEFNSLDDLNLSEELEEGEEVEEEAEEEEQAEVDPTDPEALYEATKEALKGMKGGDLRKELTARKAQIQAYEVKVKELEDKTTATIEAQEQAEQARIEREASSKLADINDYAPYRELVEKVNSGLKATQRRLSGQKQRDLLENNAVVLLDSYRKLDSLEGEARDEFEETIRTNLVDKFGERGAERVWDFMEDAYDIDQQSVEVRKDFDANVQEESVKLAATTWEEHKKSISTLASSYYEPDDKHLESNPYGIRSFVNGLKTSKEEGEKMGRIMKKDTEFVSMLLHGEPPFNADDTQWAGMSPEQAKSAYVQKKQKTAQMQAKLLPELALQGLMAERLFPKIYRNAAEGKARKAKTPLPTNGKKPAKKNGKPKNLEAAAAEAGNEFRRLTAS